MFSLIENCLLTNLIGTFFTVFFRFSFHGVFSFFVSQCFFVHNLHSRMAKRNRETFNGLCYNLFELSLFSARSFLGEIFDISSSFVRENFAEKRVLEIEANMSSRWPSWHVCLNKVCLLFSPKFRKIPRI
jgi:hypothetical protein